MTGDLDGLVARLRDVDEPNSLIVRRRAANEIERLQSAVRLARDWFKDEDDVAMADAMAEALDPIGIGSLPPDAVRPIPYDGPPCDPATSL